MGRRITATIRNNTSCIEVKLEPLRASLQIKRGLFQCILISVLQRRRYVCCGSSMLNVFSVCIWFSANGHLRYTAHYLPDLFCFVV